MRSECGARARNDTLRSRAASGIMLTGIMTGPGGAFPGLGQAGAGNARWEYMYYLLNPASGTHNIVISASASCDYIIAGAADYAGVAQVAPEATAKHIINPGTSLTTPITTITDNAWAILFENGYNGGPAPGAGTGDVSRITSGGWGLFDSGGAITPAGVYNMTTTRTSSVAIVHFIAAFAPFGGAYAYGFNMPMGGL